MLLGNFFLSGVKVELYLMKFLFKTCSFYCPNRNKNKVKTIWEFELIFSGPGIGPYFIG